MAERKDKLEEGNRIVLEMQDRTLEKNREALKLLASERIGEGEREKEKILKELDRAFLRTERKLWEDPEFVKGMEKIGNS